MASSLSSLPLSSSQEGLLSLSESSSSTSSSGDRSSAARGNNIVAASVGHDTWAGQVIRRVEEGPKWNPRPKETSSIAPKGNTDLSEQLQAIKRKFHAGRALEIKNLPEGVVEQDIRDSFPDLSILSVVIERNDGRYKPGGKLYLNNPDILDDWPKSRSTAFVKNKEVSVCIGASDGWLCLAKLPMSLSEPAFQILVASYGKVKEAFLMISERTGESKGYGLIKYMSSDAAAQAKHLLDGRELEAGHVLDCDWLNSGRITLVSLHSKCLYVNHLPQNYRDMGEFRKRFSVVKNPPYCQIAMKNGVIQNWGLVEFFDHEEAEETRDRMNGVRIHNTPIRVHYCIPGVNAINIYMQVVNAPEKKKALLHDAPSANVYSQLQKLAKQNPSFAQNLQNIIQEQISSISSNGISPSSSSSSSATDRSNGGGRSPVSEAAAVISGGSQTPSPPPSAPSHPSPVNLNANAQAALMILLTAQMQSETGEVSLLQNPQVVGILQNLVSQAGSKSSDNSLNDLLSDPLLSSVLSNNNRLQKVLHNKENRPNAASGGSRPQQTGLLVEPPAITNNNNPLYHHHQQQQHPSAAPLAQPIGHPGARKDPPFNGLLNTQNLAELLGSLNSVVEPRPVPNNTNHNNNKATVLLPDPFINRPVVTSAQQCASLLPAPLFTATPSQQHATGLQMIPAFSAAPYYINSGGLLSSSGPPPPPPQSYLPGIPLLAAAPPPLFLGSPPPVGSSSNSLFTSPSQLKRKLPIPPSPELSPEGPYIGQHSQGLGGHYADSYWRNKRSRFH